MLVVSKRYQNKKWLYDQYWNEKKSMNDIAKECKVSGSTILRWMIKFNIDRRDHSESGKIKPNSGQFKKDNLNWENNKHIGLNLKCKFCNKNFVNTHMRQKYCCVECQQKAYKEKNRERLKKKSKGYWLKNEYGLTLDQFNRLKEINDCCWICGKKYEHKNLCVDHDHKTNEVRGLLCDHCNMTLGLINENPLILIKMVHYLRKKPLSFNQSIDEIIDEIGDPTTFIQRFKKNNDILSWNVK